MELAYPFILKVSNDLLDNLFNAKEDMQQGGACVCGVGWGEVKGSVVGCILRRPYC